MKHDAKRRRLVIALMLATVLLVTIGSAFAYFTSILNNDRAEKMTLKTGTMALVFEDNDKGINKSLAFGETVTKKFTIENTGTLDASLSLDFLKLQNSYLHRSLSYNLTYSETEDGEYKELVPETNMPVSNIPITSAISGEISVPAGEKYYYNLNITLNDLPDKDQTVDLDASFSTEFTVNTPSRYRYYTLRVDPNGGVWKTYTGPQEYLLKSDEEMAIEDPTRYGYDFGGWKIIGASSEIDGLTFHMGITDTYLSARWNPHKVRVTVDGVPRQVEFGSTLDLGVPEKEGYTFTGWTATGGKLENNSLYVDEDNAIEVTSNFAINNYKYIVYHNKMNTDGETYTPVGEDTEEDEAEYGSTVNTKVKTYTGFTSPEAKSLKIQAESVYPPVLNRVDYNYARKKYTLTMNIDGNTTTEEVFYDAPRDLGIPEKTGYNFTNWTVEGAVIEGNEIKMGTNPVSATANFTPATYSVTFNPNGGTTPLTSMTVTYDSEYGELPIPTYDGYRFLGWFTDRVDGEEVTSSTKVNITSNITLFAHFEEINVLMARVDNEKIWSYKGDITKVVFEPQILSKENAAYTYDVSSKQNKSVMSYLVPTQEDSSKYTLYIQADGKIIANPDSSGLFAWFENLRNIEGLENFDTSNAYNMSDMFDRCYSLELLDLSSFDTSNVVNMGHMFNDCRSLTSLIIKNFDTRNVQYMDYMFSGNVNLELLDVSSFDTSNVVNMERMFAMWIGDWDVYGKLSEIKGLENFKTQNVTNMSRMFDRCNKLVTLNLTSFDTGNVTDMGGMFGECHSLSALDLKTFDTSKVFTMEYMFDQCYSLTSLDLSSFDTKNVTTMKKMFNECRSLPNLNLRSFDTSKVNDMSGMFFGCNNATSIDLSSFDTRSVIYMGSMFSWCWSLTALDLNHFNTSNVVDMNSMFQTCWSLTTLNLSSFDTSNVVNMANMFDMWSNDDAFPSKLETIIFSEKFNTSKVTSMDSMFSNCNSLKSLDLSSFDTSNVTNMGGIFANCSTLEKLDLSNFDTRNVTNMAMMFCMWHPAGSYDSKLSSITFSQKFDTKNVTDMSTMFYNIKVTSLDLSSFDTSNVTSMYHMFAWCRNLTSLGLSNFDTSNVDNMEELVAGCASLTSLNLENFNTSKVTSMYRMFTECTNLTSLNIKNFDISSVTEKDEFINSVPSNIKVTVGNTNLKQWVIDASNDPKLTDANFLIG